MIMANPRHLLTELSEIIDGSSLTAIFFIFMVRNWDQMIEFMVIDLIICTFVAVGLIIKKIVDQFSRKMTTKLFSDDFHNRQPKIIIYRKHKYSFRSVSNICQSAGVMILPLT